MLIFHQNIQAYVTHAKPFQIHPWVTVLRNSQRSLRHLSSILNPKIPKLYFFPRKLNLQIARPRQDRQQPPVVPDVISFSVYPVSLHSFCHVFSSLCVITTICSYAVVSLNETQFAGVVLVCYMHLSLLLSRGQRLGWVQPRGEMASPAFQVEGQRGY